MTVAMRAMNEARKPAFWYAIPHGYLSLDLAPAVENLEKLIEQVRGLPDELRDQAERVLRFYAAFVTEMNRQHVQACLVGMHPDETGGAAMSVLTVSTIPTNGSNADLVVANMAGLGAAERPEEGIVPLELPCGTGFLTERTQRATAPGRAPDGSDSPLQGTVWQGTVAAPEADQSSVILLQLVTPAIDQADDYRDILLGVAHTLTFTDPYAADSATEAGPASETQGHAEAIRNDFG